MRYVTGLCALLIAAGCGGGADYSIPTGSMAPTIEAARPPAAADRVEADAGLPGDGQLGDNGDGAQPIQRQIIYTAQLILVVEDFTGVPEQVEQLAKTHGGFVADSNLHGSSGSPRSGNWTIRVPVAQYGTFLGAARTLGEFQSLSTGSQEVTAEYYDVKARISNKQREEARLLELLEKETGKLEEILKVEEHLARVREEIERMQGRMRVLNDLTSFSTVTLTINEIKGYQPPAAPTFGNRIARAWSGTLEALLETGQNLVIAIVTLGPWLVVLAIPVLVFVALLRLVLRKRGASRRGA